MAVEQGGCGAEKGRNGGDGSIRISRSTRIPVHKNPGLWRNLMKTTGTLLIAACLMFAAAVPSLAGDAPAALAKLYGINGWDQIEELR